MLLIDLFNLASDSKKAEVFVSVSHALSISTFNVINMNKIKLKIDWTE